MLTLLTIAHLVIGVHLFVVCCKIRKAAPWGVFSGGSSSNSFFGASGASNFLTSTTKWLAILFAVTSLTLTYMTSKKGGSVMDSFAPPAATTPPAAQPTNEIAPGQQSLPGTNPALPAETPASDAPKK